MNGPRADPAKHAAIKYTLDIKLATFSYRSILPSFQSKTLLNWRSEMQDPRIASAKNIDTYELSVYICSGMMVKWIDMKISLILYPKYTWFLQVLQGQLAGHSLSRTGHWNLPVRTFFLIPDSFRMNVFSFFCSLWPAAGGNFCYFLVPFHIFACFWNDFLEFLQKIFQVHKKFHILRLFQIEACGKKIKIPHLNVEKNTGQDRSVLIDWFWTMAAKTHFVGSDLLPDAIA